MNEAADRGVRAGWIRSGPWDAFWVLSGLWLAVLVVILMRDGMEVGFDRIDSVYFVLTIAFWIGHRFSSTYLAYFTTAYRPLLTTQRVRFVWVPLAITALVVAILVPPDDAWPWTRAQRVMALAILDYLFVTWHFLAQHYGLLSLYRLRAGQARTQTARRIDRIYAIVVGGVFVVVAEAFTGYIAFQDVWVDPWLDPEWLEAIRPTVRQIGLGLVGAAVLGMGVFEVRSGRPSVARMAYVVGMGVMVAAALYLHPFLFIVLWTAQHWMAATGLASLVPRSEPDPGASPWYRFWHVANRHAWVVVLLLVVASVVLTPWMEVEALAEGDAYYGLRVFPFLAETLARPGIIPWLVALGFVTGFVHYALDRAVYRLSDPAVRTAARGLLEGPTP